MNKPKPKAQKEVQKEARKKALSARVYHHGMQLADCLRLLGKHEESHDLELWILALTKEMKGATK